MNEVMSSINIDLTIPGTKVKAAAMLVMEQYKVIVDEALKEVREELAFDECFQDAVKKAIKTRVEYIIKEGIDDAAKRAVDDAFYANYGEIREQVKQLVISKIGKE